MVSFGYLDGNCPDNVSDLLLEEVKQNPEKAAEAKSKTNEKIKKLLIEAIVENIASAMTEESLQPSIVKVLLAIFESPKCEVHERTLQEIFRAFYYIQISSNIAASQFLRDLSG